MKIEFRGKPLLVIERKEKPAKQIEQPSVMYSNCVFGKPFIITVPCAQTQPISNEQLEKARKQVIEHVFLKTGIDKSTIELILLTTDDFYEGK